MRNKKRFSSNLIYLILAIFIAIFQFTRISDISFGFQASTSARAYYPYLILLGSIPVIVYFFIYVPALFVVKVSILITIASPIFKEIYLQPSVIHTYIYNRKPKQSSLQVFRC